MIKVKRKVAGFNKEQKKAAIFPSSFGTFFVFPYFFSFLFRLQGEAAAAEELDYDTFLTQAGGGGMVVKDGST